MNDEVSWRVDRDVGLLDEAAERLSMSRHIKSIGAVIAKPAIIADRYAPNENFISLLRERHASGHGAHYHIFPPKHKAPASRFYRRTAEAHYRCWAK